MRSFESADAGDEDDMVCSVDVKVMIFRMFVELSQCL